MSARPVEQRQAGDEGRLLAELEAVAADALEGTEAQQQSPRDAADVQAMDADQRRAWFASTSGKQRWEVVGRTDQRRPPADPQYAARAACRGTSADLVELTSQAEAAEHVMDMCAECPVLDLCAEDARDFSAHGLWAGVVLVGHKVAPEQLRGTQVDRAARNTAWLADQFATHGPMTQARLLAAAKPHRIGTKGLQTAADTLGILRPPPGHIGPWRLPEQAQPDEQQPQQPEQPDQPEQQPAQQAVAKPVHRGQRAQPRRARPRSQRRKARS